MQDSNNNYPDNISSVVQDFNINSTNNFPTVETNMDNNNPDNVSSVVQDCSIDGTINFTNIISCIYPDNITIPNVYQLIIGQFPEGMSHVKKITNSTENITVERGDLSFEDFLQKYETIIFNKMIEKDQLICSLIKRIEMLEVKLNPYQAC